MDPIIIHPEPVLDGRTVEYAEMVYWYLLHNLTDAAADLTGMWIEDMTPVWAEEA